MCLPKIYFSDFYFDAPKYDEEYSRYKDLTYEMSLRVKCKLVNKRTKSKKEQIVSKLSQLVKKADLVVFLKFKKLTVAKASELRRKLRGVGGSYIVAKKRLQGIDT